jgi:hypothetical protein
MSMTGIPVDPVGIIGASVTLLTAKSCASAGKLHPT